MRLADLSGMRAKMLFRRGEAGARLDREIEFHLEQHIEETIAAGMNREEARAAALRAFGNPALVRDQARAVWNWSVVESMMRDLRYAARALRRTPGFTLTAILIIALGIGANVALFTVVRGMLLKPPLYRDPDWLVSLFESGTPSASKQAIGNA